MICHMLWLIHGNPHLQHPKKNKKQPKNSETRWKMTEDSMVKRERNQVDK